ncbi:MAG: glycine hydroxymethyltransferase, partial [Solirubrobacterales bacterium]|nr:glycine hydroxymethyltransferase [Solirubrobacterales bacterium]
MSEQSLSTESTAFRSALDVIRAVEPRVADAISQEVAD